MQYRPSAVRRNRQLKCLTEEIEAFLSPVCAEAELYALIKEPLSKPGRGLAVDEKLNKPWPLLPILVSEAISNRWQQALPAAAAIQLLLAAGDVFDDIEDDDSPDSLPAKYGSAVATNIATTLLILAQRATVRFKERGVPDNLVIRVMSAINSYYTTACAGQHLDLSLHAGNIFSEDAYLRVIAMKSASQIECACNVGALLAGANEDLVEKCSSFGRELGMAAQIANDIQGIKDSSDILRRKITLPIIFALEQSETEVQSYLESVFLKPSTPDTGQVRNILFHSGAIHYAVVKMELYKQKAQDILSEIEEAGARAEPLRLFI